MDISCAVHACGVRATHGTLNEHRTPNATAHPVYYYCGEHVSARMMDAVEVWPVGK